MPVALSATTTPLHAVTYWQFHGVFLLPVFAVLLGRQRWRGRPVPPRVWTGIVVAAVIALVYTAPWDNYLIRRGVWSYPPGRVTLSWRIGYVPLEEYLFFVLQPILTGLCLWSFGLAQDQDRGEGVSPRRRLAHRLTGATVAVFLGGVGLLALATGGRWLYAGLILVWSTPPLALHWLYGGDMLWENRRAALLPLGLATVYLWAADRVAIGAGIWSVSPLFSTGWTLLGLPVEEALFFAVTNLLIVQTLLLFWHRFSPGCVADAIPT